MADWFWVPLLAFLLGSIPFGFLLVRLRTGGDVRQNGSGNIGATNVLRTAGEKLGLLTLALDAGKGVAAILVARQLAPAQPALAAAALLAVILGHLFPPWLGFHGGKGVATGLGAFAALTPLALLAALGVFAVVLGFSHYVSLASICACVALPLLLLIPGWGSTPVVAVAAVAAGLIIFRHRANIARLRAGTEARLGAH